MGVVLLVFWLVVAVLIGFVCTVVGENKGIGGIRWFVLSLFIGPLALIAVAAMPDLRTRRILRLIAENQGVELSEKRRAPTARCWTPGMKKLSPGDQLTRVEVMGGRLGGRSCCRFWAVSD